MTAVFLFTLGWITFLSEAKSLQESRVIHCETSPEEVEIGGNATVTCYLPYDVSQLSSVSVTFERFLDDDPGRDYDVIECLKTTTPELNCIMHEDGYVIEGDIKTSLTVRIANVSAQHSGHFRCQMMISEDEGEVPKPKTCYLNVAGVTPVPKTTETIVETSAGSDLNEETNSAVIIASVVIPVVVVAVVIAIFVYKNRKNQQGSNNGQGDTDGRRGHPEPGPEGGIEEEGNQAEAAGGDQKNVPELIEHFENLHASSTPTTNDVRTVSRVTRGADYVPDLQRTDNNGGGETTGTGDETNDGGDDKGNAKKDDNQDEEAEPVDETGPLLPAKS